MVSLREWIGRLRETVRPKRDDSDLEQELRLHSELVAEEAARSGHAPDQARQAAQIQVGGIPQAMEALRDQRGLPWLDELFRDVHLALRMLRKSLGFATVAILTLALGIGATTAIFTLVEQVMMRPLPVVEPERLWRVGETVGCCYATGYAQNEWRFFPWEAYRLFRANTPAFEELAAFQVGSALLGVRPHGSPGAIVTANGQFVSGNFFRTFGVNASLGRLFIEGDDQKGAPPVAVISFHTWQEKYGSAQSVVGGSYQINGRPFTIVGVAQPGFFGAKVADSGMPDFWLPLTTEPVVVSGTSRLEDPGTAWLDVIGRVRRNTNPKTVEAQLQVELHAWLASHLADMTAQERASWEQQTVHLAPGGAGVSLMRVTYEDGLRLLLWAAICVLVVACANVANLLLVRGLRHRDQTALRAALGASRLRLVRAALVESLTLAVFGAAAGIAVAYAGTSIILRLAFGGPDTWVPMSASPSGPVLLVAIGTAIVTGVVFGMTPAWMISQADPIEALRGVNRSAGSRRHWAQKTLVIGQAAVSLALLSAAAMLGRSLHNLEHQDFGFDLSDRYLVKINTMLSGYNQEQLVPAFTEIDDHLRAVPGVRRASAALYAPMSQFNWRHNIRIVGTPVPGPKDDVSSAWTRVMPGFFETLGNRIVMGRPIAEEDNATSRPVAVINEAFAKRFFGKANPIGQHFGPASRRKAGVYEIVGVASDVRYFADFGRPVGPMYFISEAQTAAFDEPSLQAREVGSHFPYSIVIWAPGHPPDFEKQVTKALADFEIPMYDVRSYSDVVHADYAQQNLLASLTWLFGALALVLAAVGLYGVTGYSVEQRTSEIGVRVALGANRGQVVRMVLRGALLPLAIGLAIGIPAAIAVGHLMASQLFDVKPSDPRVLSVATLLLIVAALVAALIPARRATTVDPMVALRHE
jgi:putative ABC transport system permease protein